MQLDARLQSAAELVRWGSVAADIGCDHGKLTAVLLNSGRCPKVVAADLRPGPLAVAKKNLEHARCLSRADLRLGNGLTVVQPGEVQDIVIAGMGAETICQILEAADWIKNPAIRLVLLPATKHSILRQWLCRNGFALRQEILSTVSGRHYTCIAAEYDGNCFEPDGLLCVAGLTQNQPTRSAYLQQQIVKIEKYCRGLQQGDEVEQVKQLICQLKALANQS